MPKVKRVMRNKAIVLTGGTGYLGSSLVNYWQEHTLQLGDITIIDRTLKTNRIKKPEQIKFIQADLNSVDLSYLSPETVVIHTSYCKNINAEKNFLTKLNPDLYLVYFSSAAVYGDVLDTAYLEALNVKEDYKEKISIKHKLSPINDYGRYKIELENFIRERFSKHLILRIANPYGNEPDIRGVYKIFESQINSGAKQVNINADFPKQIVRDFIHVNELSRQVTELIQKHAQGIYNIGTGEGLSLEELVEQIAGDRDIQINYCGYKNEILYSVLEG